MNQQKKLILSIILLICLFTFFATAGSDSTTTPGLQNKSFVAFESGHVRPLAISPNSQTLCAVNTPDNRIEVFDIADNTLKHRFSIPVGLEPVAIAMPDNNEAWVVNHLSDSVSIVRIESTRATSRVIRTLLVGDEPQDIVFAGPGKSRAFISCAHRGQNAPFNPQFTTQGVGRADVWVFSR
jgi:DNA-binding beta-propeller fold protein YncE